MLSWLIIHWLSDSARLLLNKNKAFILQPDRKLGELSTATLAHFQIVSLSLGGNIMLLFEWEISDHWYLQQSKSNGFVGHAETNITFLFPSESNSEDKKMENKKPILSSFILILSAFNSHSPVLRALPLPPPTASFISFQASSPTHRISPTTHHHHHLTPLPNFLHPLSCPWTRIRLIQSICISSSWLCCFRFPNSSKNLKSLSGVGAAPCRPSPHAVSCHRYVHTLVPLVSPVWACMQPYACAHVCTNYSEALMASFKVFHFHFAFY